MKKIFFLMLLASVVFAQLDVCPEGCECLSEIEFMEKYDKTDFLEYFCLDDVIECGYDTVHDMPRFCFTIPPEEVGTGKAETGPNDPGDHGWYYDPDSDDIWNEMFQLKISAGMQESIKLMSITLKAFGTGNDATDIARTEVYIDLEGNGVVDETDIKIGAAEPAYGQDDGRKQIGLGGFKIGKGSSKYLIVSYVMSVNAPVGKTYGFTVEKIRAKGENTGVGFDIGGLPKNSSTKTIIAPPPRPCTGNITLTLNQTSASPNASITGTVEGLRNCNKTIGIYSMPCNFLTQLAPECSCNVNTTTTGCSCDFTAPSEEGEYAYYACVDIDGDTAVDDGEQASESLTVEVEEIEEVQRCSADAECADDERCTEGKCVEVTGTCGYASNHAWISHECGDEPNCPACPRTEVCEDRECVLYELEAPADASTGEEVTTKVLREDRAAGGKDVIVRDPEGTEVRKTTDEAGEASFTPELEGTYTINLMDGTQVIISKELNVSRAEVPIYEKISQFFYSLIEEPVKGTIFLIIVLLAAGLILYRLYRGERQEEGEREQV